jgi:hypothetical protein
VWAEEQRQNLTEPDCIVELDPLNGELIPPSLPFFIFNLNDNLCPEQHDRRGGITFHFKFPHAANLSRFIIKTESYGELSLDLSDSKRIFNPPIQDVKPITDLHAEFSYSSSSTIELLIDVNCQIETSTRLAYFQYKVRNRNLLDNAEYEVNISPYMPYWPLTIPPTDSSVYGYKTIYGGLSWNGKPSAFGFHEDTVGPGVTTNHQSYFANIIGGIVSPKTK